MLEHWKVHILNFNWEKWRLIINFEEFWTLFTATSKSRFWKSNFEVHLIVFFYILKKIQRKILIISLSSPQAPIFFDFGGSVERSSSENFEIVRISPSTILKSGRRGVSLDISPPDIKSSNGNSFLDFINSFLQYSP